MKKLALALVAFAFAAPSAAPAQDIAPAVKRKPAAAPTVAPAPVQPAPAVAAPAAPQQAAPASATQPAPQQAAAAAPAPAAPRPAGRFANERDVQAALTAAAAQGGDASALDSSLIRVMSRLVTAGRCGEAAGLAARDGRKELASRAQQLCK